MTSKRHLRSRFLTAVGVVNALFFLSSTQAGNAQTGEQTTAEGLIREAQQHGNVKIIVKLPTAFRPEGELRSAQDVVTQRADVADGQERVLAAVAGHAVSGIKRFQFVPYMA